MTDSATAAKPSFTPNPEAEAAFNECMALLDQLMARLDSVPVGVDVEGKPRPQVYFMGFLAVESADGGSCKGGGVTHARGDQMVSAISAMAKDMPFQLRMSAMMGDLNGK